MEVGEEGYGASDSSVGGVGVRVAIGGTVVEMAIDGARAGVTAGISEALRVVSRPGDRCGVNAGFEDVVERVWDGPSPDRMRSLSSEPNGQMTDDKLSKPTYHRWRPAIGSTFSSTNSTPPSPGNPQTFDPYRAFLRNRHCERWVSEALV